MDMKTGSIAALATTTLVWALVWALPGGAIEAVDNVAPGALSFAGEVDMWPQTLGIPGLLAGVLFWALLMITERGRSVAELSPARSGAWGAVSGVLIGALVVWVMDTGLSDPWQLATALVGIAALLGAVSGVVSPLVFRYATQRRVPAIH